MCKPQNEEKGWKQMKKKNRGFTLVEMVVIISIFVLLLGIMVPSLNSILGFRVQRAANSIASALDKTKIEASSRLIGEMKLEIRSDGYYISYILDRGKVNGQENIKTNEDEEKIAPSKTQITYVINGEEKYLKDNESIVITYDRATGAFLPVQQQSEDCWNGFDSWAWETLRRGNSIYADRENQLTNLGNCERIVVKGGSRIRNIVFYTDTGKYEITAG